MGALGLVSVQVRAGSSSGGKRAVLERRQPRELRVCWYMGEDQKELERAQCVPPQEHWNRYGAMPSPLSRHLMGLHDHHVYIPWAYVSTCCLTGCTRSDLQPETS